MAKCTKIIQISPFCDKCPLLDTCEGPKNGRVCLPEGDEAFGGGELAQKRYEAYMKAFALESALMDQDTDGA